MRVMVLVKATADSEAGIMPSVDLFEAMGRFNEELVAAGIMLSGDGLKPSAQGKRVAFDGPARRVIDGPFAETREQLLGFFIIDCADAAAAEAAASDLARANASGTGVYELRPLYLLKPGVLP